MVKTEHGALSVIFSAFALIACLVTYVVFGFLADSYAFHAKQISAVIENIDKSDGDVSRVTFGYTVDGEKLFCEIVSRRLPKALSSARARAVTHQLWYLPAQPQKAHWKKSELKKQFDQNSLMVSSLFTGLRLIVPLAIVLIVVWLLQLSKPRTLDYLSICRPSNLYLLGSNSPIPGVGWLYFLSEANKKLELQFQIRDRSSEDKRPWFPKAQEVRASNIKLAEKFDIRSNAPTLMEQALSKAEVTETLLDLIACGNGYLQIELNKFHFAIRLENAILNDKELGQFYENAVELTCQIIETAFGLEITDRPSKRKKTLGVGATKQEVSIASITVLEDGANVICQVCGGQLTGNVVKCAACTTAHHLDCWNYMGQCSTYGCGSTRCM